MEQGCCASWSSYGWAHSQPTVMTPPTSKTSVKSLKIMLFRYEEHSDTVQLRSTSPQGSSLFALADATECKLEQLTVSSTRKIRWPLILPCSTGFFREKPSFTSSSVSKWRRVGTLRGSCSTTYTKWANHIFTEGERNWLTRVICKDVPLLGKAGTFSTDFNWPGSYSKWGFYM